MAGAAITLDELLEDVGVCPEKLEKHISKEHICEIALILTEWKAVVPFLGLDENDVEAIEQEEKKEQVRKLKALRKWRGKDGCRATYKKLVVVLLKLAKADIADEVCRLLKGIVVCECSELIMKSNSAFTVAKQLTASPSGFTGITRHKLTTKLHRYNHLNYKSLNIICNFSSHNNCVTEFFLWNCPATGCVHFTLRLACESSKPLKCCH